VVFGNTNAVEICTVISFVKSGRRAHKVLTFSIAMFIIRPHEATLLPRNFSILGKFTNITQLLTSTLLKLHYLKLESFANMVN
jgi:hypothetical protein